MEVKLFTIRKYTKEFKLDTISLVRELGYLCPEAVRSLEINSNILSHWIQEFTEDNKHAFRGNDTLTEKQLEIPCLREEVERLHCPLEPTQPFFKILNAQFVCKKQKIRLYL